MNKLTLTFLMTLSLAQAYVPGTKQGYSDPRQTNPMGPSQSYQDYRKSVTPPPRPTRPAPDFTQSAPALPPRPTAAAPVQGIVYGEIKAKFGNLRDLMAAIQNLIQVLSLALKYGNNLHEVENELTKLEHTAGNGRDLASIHDHEILENRTFGKSNFDQERYNNLLGITKQTAMSACSDKLQSVQHGVRVNSNSASQMNATRFIDLCSKLKGTHDVPQFTKMVNDLTSLSKRGITSSESANMSAVEVPRHINTAGNILKSLYVLAKSKLLSKQDNMAAQMKQLISTYKTLDKLARSKKAAGQDLSSQVHNLLDQIHRSANNVCAAIGRNAPSLAERAGKGKKADLIKSKSATAIDAFNDSCRRMTDASTGDLTKDLTLLITKEKAIVAALKGK